MVKRYLFYIFILTSQGFTLYVEIMSIAKMKDSVGLLTKVNKLTRPPLTQAHHAIYVK